MPDLMCVDLEFLLNRRLESFFVTSYPNSVNNCDLSKVAKRTKTGQF